MIEISLETGMVTWGDVVLNLDLTHDAFVQQYPTLTAYSNSLQPHGLHLRQYSFEAADLDHFPVTLRLTFYNQRLSGIYAEHSISLNPSDDEDELWWQQLPEWVRTAQNWLVNQLGQPHEIDPGVLFDGEEKLMTPEEIKRLQIWNYKFEWGEAGFHYDGLEAPGDIFVHYYYHQQIKNWDGLAAECKTSFKNEQARNGTRNIGFLAVRALINQIGPYFDFLKLKPRIQEYGLWFPLPEWQSHVSLMVKFDGSDKAYEISRPDVGFKFYTSDVDKGQLIDALKIFLETEKM